MVTKPAYGGTTCTIVDYRQINDTFKKDIEEKIDFF